MSFEKRDRILASLQTKSKRALYKMPRPNRRGKYPLPYKPRRELLERLEMQLGYPQSAIEAELRAIRKEALQSYGVPDWLVQHLSGLH